MTLRPSNCRDSRVPTAKRGNLCGRVAANRAADPRIVTTRAAGGAS
jgi:hypothetical protein